MRLWEPDLLPEWRQRGILIQDQLTQHWGLCVTKPQEVPKIPENLFKTKLLTLALLKFWTRWFFTVCEWILSTTPCLLMLLAEFQSWLSKPSLNITTFPERHWLTERSLALTGIQTHQERYQHVWSSSLPWNLPIFHSENPQAFAGIHRPLAEQWVFPPFGVSPWEIWYINVNPLRNYVAKSPNCQTV